MQTKTLTIRVSEEWLEALDGWISRQAVKPTRTEVIRVAVEKFCSQRRKTAMNDDATQTVFEVAHATLVEKLLPELESAHHESVRDQAKNTLDDALNNTWQENMTLAEWEQAVRARLRN